MTLGSTPEQVATQVAMIRRQRPEDRLIGIYTPGTWLGGSELKVARECLPVAFCASALQISEALMSHDTDGPPLVLITNLEDGCLSLDVLARFAARRLFRIDRWEIVRDGFRARQLDPRLPSQGWLANALLQHMPEGAIRRLPVVCSTRIPSGLIFCNSTLDSQAVGLTRSHS